MASVEAFITANRFGLGARPGELGEIGRDPRGWLEDQIAAPATVPPEISEFPSAADVFRVIHETRIMKPREMRKELRREQRKVLLREIAARCFVMARSKQSFRERMVLFWSNHFTVSMTRGVIAPTVAAYEREAIRPHVFARFEDMLLAVVHHPSMLTYLDNHLSIGPHSLAGLRRGRGLNENLAREILELHTLGVNGGYTQRDVTEFARMLTGWAHGGNRSKNNIGTLGPVHGAFEYRANFHEPGAKTLLGRVYHENGEQEAADALRALACHPSTARLIATKLARHFIADDPPADAVHRLERAFRDSGGHLGAVSRALIGLDAPWRQPLTKYKTPYELVVSTLRAVGLDEIPQRRLLGGLRQLGHFPFTAPSPAGWPDRAGDWISPEALMGRIEWGRAVARRLPSALRPAGVAEDVVGPALSARTRSMIDAAPSARDGLALLFASPEFQKR